MMWVVRVFKTLDSRSEHSLSLPHSLAPADTLAKFLPSEHFLAPPDSLAPPMNPIAGSSPDLSEAWTAPATQTAAVGG